MIRSVYLLPYNLGTSYLVHTLILVRHVTPDLDLILQSTLLHLGHVLMIRSVSLTIHSFILFGPHIDHGRYMYMSPDLDLILRSTLLHLRLEFVIRSVSLTIQHSFTLYVPHIDHGGYMHMSASLVSHDLNLIFTV